MKPRLVALVFSGFVLAVGAGGQARQAPSLQAAVRNLATLASPASEGAMGPNLAADSRGRVWLTWLEPRPGGGHRLRLTSLAGAAWSEPLTIAQGTNFLANWADFPSLFVARDGTMAAHWLERGNGRSAYGIRVSTSRDAGRTWSSAVTPHQDASASEHGFVSFFDDPGGGVGMVWLDGRAMAGGEHAAHANGGASMALRATTVRGGKAGDDIVVDPRVCDCCQTSSAQASDAVLVAYRDRSDKEIRDTSVVRYAGGRWSSPVTVHADNWEINGCPVNGPVITASGNSAAVAWFTSAGDAPRTMVAFSADGGRTFDAPIRLDTSVTLGRLSMVMPAADRVLVSSLERTATGAHLVLRDVRRDRRVSAPLEIAQATPERAGGFVRMAHAGSKLVIAWTEVRPGAATAVRTAVAEVR